MRKNDERNPRPVRGSDEKGSQNYNQNYNQSQGRWVVYFDTFCFIARICKFKNYDVSNLNVIRKVTEALHEKPNMSAIRPVLPSHDELEKVNEIEYRLKRYPYLERCYFGSDSAIAGLREFYSEIGRLRGQSSELAFEQGVTSLQIVINALKTLIRTQARSEKILAWAGLQSASVEMSELILNPDLSSEKQRNKFCRLIKKIHYLGLKTYDSISNVVNTSWDYLPAELQDALQSLAQRIVLNAPQIEQLRKRVSVDYLSERIDTTEKTCSNLVTSVFTAVEDSENKPKLQLLRLFEGWDFTHDAPEQKLTASPAMSEIQELTQNLVELSGVEQAEAITHVVGDLHRVTFYLKLSADIDGDSGFDNAEELWEAAERMALRAHRRLRQLTGEKWYFHVELNEGFSDYPNSNYVLAIAHAQFNNPHSAS